MSPFAAWVEADLESVPDANARALLAPLRGLTPAKWTAPLDAARFEALVVENRVVGELRSRIAAAGGEAPAWVAGYRPVLEARALSLGHSNAVKAAAVKAAGEAFRARGFEAVAFKGFHLACGVYADPADRPFGDVDLFVRPQDLKGAEEALLSLGFQRGIAQTGAGAMEKSFLREVGPGVVLDVDLHWKLIGSLSLMREMRPDDEGTFARSVPAFPGLRFPSRDDAFLLAAVNLVRRRFRPLGNILDFRELLRGADLSGLAARAAGTRSFAALSAGFALAEVLFGAVIPESLAKALVLPRWQRAAFRRLLRPALLVQPGLADGAMARYVLKIVSQDGAGGVARSVGGLPGIALRRMAGRFATK